MSFNWLEYLVLAQELTAKSATSPIQEANLRSAISRAYYAAIHKAQDHLIYKDNSPIPYPVNIHFYIVTEFENSKDETRKKIGALLHHLRSIRNIADYQDTFFGNLQGRTQGVLLEAEEVFRLLDTLSSQPPNEP